MIKLISGKMGGWLKEDEKNEKIIRGLLKQPANRKCINCSMLGPQYACTTFSTFICTTCSGIHREFTHRVKSVSMAKFTEQEISYLQDGGNERAREIYFKEWDPQRNFPDSNNVDRLREFIKHVYVHRRYTGERSNDRSPQVDKEEANDNKISDLHRVSQTSPNDDTCQGPTNDVRRGAGYEQHDKRHNELPARSGVLNDWRREDRFSNGRKSVDCRSSVGESKSKIRSLDSRKNSDISSPPKICPVSDLLGDNVVPLQIELPKKNDSTSGLTFTQETACSSSLAPSNGNAAEVMKETSLIDFDTEPEPPLMAGEPQLQQSTSSQSVGQSTSTQSNDNWDFLNNVQDDKVSQTPPNGILPSSIGGNLQLVPFSHTGSSNQGLTDSSVADKYGRKELPLDIFASTYVAGPYQAPGWQASVGPGMGYPFQYNTVMQSKPSNPFDANAEASTTFVTVLPSMSPLHAALPSVEGPRGLAETATPSWISPQPSSYPSTVPLLAQSFGSRMPGSYMGQQFPGNLAALAPSRPQGFGALGSQAPHPPVGANPFA